MMTDAILMGILTPDVLIFPAKMRHDRTIVSITGPKKAAKMICQSPTETYTDSQRDHDFSTDESAKIIGIHFN